MNELGRYRVSGRRAYRGHAPGVEFEARLDRAAEIRAVNRGSIVLLGRVAADLIPGSYQLPAGWPNNEKEKSHG